MVKASKTPKAPVLKDEDNGVIAQMKIDDNVGTVLGRFEEMRIARSIVDVNWPIYKKQIDAIYKDYPDGRSSSVIPLASTIIELGIAEELNVPLDYSFRSDADEEKYKSEALEIVWNHLYMVNNYDWETIRNAYTTWGYGTGILYTNYVRTIKQQYETNYDSISGPTYDKKYLIKNDIVVQNFDIARFYPDNRVINFDDSIDCIATQTISYEEFQNFKNNPMYKNCGKITGVGYYDVQYSPSNPSEEEKTKTGKFVHLLNYWNVQKDWYMCIANGTTVIREHPIMTTRNGEKAIPFTMRNLGLKEKSLWGRGICEICMQYQSKLNDLDELIMDGARRSNSETIILGDGLEIEGQKFHYGNRILQASGILRDNFNQIVGTPPNQAIFNYRESILNDISIFVGLDIKNLVGDAKTAFQADLVRESSQKRVNVWLQNRNMAMERYSDLLKDLIQNFYALDVPKKLVKSLTETDAITPMQPKIELKGKKFVNKKFVKTHPTATDIMEVTPEMLKGSIYVDVTTNTAQVSSRAIKKAQMLDFVKGMGPMIQSYEMAKQAGLDIEHILPLQKTLESMAKEFDIPTEEATNQGDLKKQLAGRKNDLTALAVKMGINPNATPPQTPEGAPATPMMPAQGGAAPTPPSGGPSGGPQTPAGIPTPN